MARLDMLEAAPIVQDFLRSKGGEMSHNDLVSGLEAAGHTREANVLMALRKQGSLVFRVDYDTEAQKATLMVTLPA